MEFTWRSLREFFHHNSFDFPPDLEPLTENADEFVPSAILEACIQSMTEHQQRLAQQAEETRRRVQRSQQLLALASSGLGKPFSTPAASSLSPGSSTYPTSAWTPSTTSSTGESSDKRKQFLDPDGRVLLLHSVTSAVSDSENSLFLRRCTDPSRLSFYTSGEGLKLDSAKALRTITTQASRLHIESGTADPAVGSSVTPSWVLTSKCHLSASPPTPLGHIPLVSSVWSSTNLFSSIRSLPIFGPACFDMFLRGKWGEGCSMLNLSYFSTQPHLDTWHSLHESLRNLESTLVVVFGSAWDTCLWDLSQAMLSHLQWRVYPTRFIRWIVELTLTNFFLIASQSYSASDMQYRHPGAPTSLLLPDDAVLLFRVLITGLNPTYTNHQYYLAEIAPLFHELFPSWRPTKVSGNSTTKSVTPNTVKNTASDTITKEKRDKRGAQSASRQGDPKSQRVETSSAASPKKQAESTSPCIRHMATLFKVDGALPCVRPECQFTHYTNKKAVPVQATLSLLSTRPPRGFTPSVLASLTEKLAYSAQRLYASVYSPRPNESDGHRKGRMTTTRGRGSRDPRSTSYLFKTSELSS